MGLLLLPALLSLLAPLPALSTLVSRAPRLVLRLVLIAVLISSFPSSTLALLVVLVRRTAGLCDVRVAFAGEEAWLRSPEDLADVRAIIRIIASASKEFLCRSYA